MRLLQVSLRSLLIYSLVLVLVSVPIVLLSIRQILNKEIDASLSLNTIEFVEHIKNFEYLDDLDTDLQVLDQLSYNIRIRPSRTITAPFYETVVVYDSLERTEHRFRQLSSGVMIQGKPYLLIVSLSQVENDDLIMAIGTVQLVLIFLLTTGLLFINRALSKKLWKPFYKTISKLKAFEIDRNQAFEIGKTNIVEFDDLNDAIRNVTDRNRQVFLQQKEFIENAAHELQTPLAIFQSKLDVLMQQPSLSAHQAQTIFELESTAQRMSRLNRNLLLLSKIDNEQFIADEEVNLEVLLFDLLDKIQPIASLNGIAINRHIESGGLKANRALIEILLTNLLHNAIRHSPNERTVTVHFSHYTLEVSNPGLPLKNPDKIFERFSKESTNPNSTGLGLAIVKKICDVCSFNLHYRYQDAQHVFTIVFTPDYHLEKY